MNNSNINVTDYFITREQYENYRFVIYLICIPVIALTGISGNSLSLYVLQKYPTKHAFAVYLKSLTTVDTTLLCAASLRSLFKVFVYNDIRHASTIDTYGSFYLGIVIGGLLQRLSSTFITVISIERFLAVFFPLRIRTMLIETRPSRVMTALLVIHLLLQLPTFVFVEVKEMTLFGNMTLLIISRTSIAGQQPLLTSGYLFSIAFIGVALPLVFVLISTVCLIVRLNMYHNTHITKFKVSRGSFETEKMTMTLIGIATCFTIMSVPAVFIYVWSAVDQSIKYTYLRLFFTDLNVVLICINSASDFVIYCMTSKTFRVLFIDSVMHTCKGGPQPGQETQSNLQVTDTPSREAEASDATADTLSRI